MKQDYYCLNLTHSNEECIQVMEDVVREYIDHRDSIVMSQGNTEDTWITDEVADLMIEYSPALFNTLPSDRDLYKEIREFAGKINLWCNNNRVYKYSKDYIANTRPVIKKSKGERAKALRSAVADIKGIIGEGRLDPQFLDSLNTVDEYAEELADRSPSFSLSRKNTGIIKQYLRDFEMPHSSNEIEEFVQKLNKLK